MDLETIMANNQFASGGLVLMLLGSVLAICRNIPELLWAWLMRRLFLDITILQKDDAFDWIETWLARHNYSERKARDLNVCTARQGRRTNEMPTILFSPAPGTHWFTWRGYFLSVYRGKEESRGAAAPTSPAQAASMGQEYFCISILSRDRAVMHRLIEDAYAAANPETDQIIYVRLPHYGDWSRDMERRLRPLESVIFPGGVLEGLLDDVKQFLREEDWYLRTGIPHRRGYLLYGPPGNGKSSAVMAIASAMKMDICVMSLSNMGMDDNALRSCFADIPPESIVLIEDVDCVFEQRQRKEGAADYISFSGLLNAIDGVVASEGRLLFMTTNYIEKLDPALIRPGRTDVKLFVDNASASQAERLFLRFFPDEPDHARRFAEQGAGRSMASLQGHLLMYRKDLDLACDLPMDLSEQREYANLGGI
jgi:chaperone BCS1